MSEFVIGILADLGIDRFSVLMPEHVILLLVIGVALESIMTITFMVTRLTK